MIRRPFVALLILSVAWSAAARGQSVLEPDQVRSLESTARDRYERGDLAAAADTYLTLANGVSDPARRAEFALLAGWILHQSDRPTRRDEALLLALRHDPELEVDLSLYSADFLQRLESLRTRSTTERALERVELVERAQAALGAERWREAATHYGELVELEPADARWRMQKSVAELNGGMPDAALATLATIEADLPRMAPEAQQRALLLKTTAQIRSGRPTEAEGTIPRITDTQRQRQLWLELASRYQEQENWEEAAGAFGHALELDPTDRGTALFRAQLLGHRLGRWRDAESFLLSLGETLPDSNAVWNELGFVRERIDDLPGARAAYRRGSQAPATDEVDRKGRVASLVAVARLEREEDPGAAAEAVSAALAAAPDDPDALAMEARLAADRGEHDRAIAAARRALEQDPDRVDLRNLVGTTYYVAGRPREAIATFEAILSDHPGLAAAEENLRLAREMAAQGVPGVPGAPATSPSSSPNDSGGPPAARPTAASSPTTASTDPRPDPSGLPVGLALSSHRWAQTGRQVVRVERVDEGGKGSRCGLRAGDLVIRVDGRPAAAPADVTGPLESDPVGLRLEVVRDAEPLALVCI